MANEEVVTREEGSGRVVRLMRPSVIVLCGPAACGKSTFARRHFRPTQIVSSDQARALVCDDEKDQRFQTQAFALVHFLIEQRLSINRLCIVDSTALTQQARKNLLDIARRYLVPCVVLLLDVPLETCLERDAARERTVGRSAIERQYQLFEQVKASIKQEGFDQVIELSEAEMEKVQFEILFRPVARPPVSVAPAETRPPHRPPRDAQTPSGYRGRSMERRPPARTQPFARPAPRVGNERVRPRSTAPPAPAPDAPAAEAPPPGPEPEPEN